MGFPVGYTELFLPKLLLHTLSFLGLIRKLISWLFQTLGLGDFLESDIAWPESSSLSSSSSSSSSSQYSELHSFSAIILREILPIVKYQDLDEKETQHQENCAVCLSEFEGEDEIRRLANCRHIFHRICLDRWMDHDQKTCPLCRTHLIPDEMQGAFNERLSIATGIPEEYYSG